MVMQLYKFYLNKSFKYGKKSTNADYIKVRRLSMKNKVLLCILTFEFDYKRLTSTNHKLTSCRPFFRQQNLNMAVKKTVLLLLVIMSPDVLMKEQPVRPGGMISDSNARN